MYTIDDLNVRLLSELKDIAEGMGIKNAKKLSKQDLVYKILDEQAVSPETAPAAKKAITQEGEPERKMRPRRRENVAPTPTKAESELSSEELLDSINIDFNNSVANTNPSHKRIASAMSLARTNNNSSSTNSDRSATSMAPSVMKVRSKLCRMDMASFALLIITTWQARMILMYRHRKSSYSA
jgi:hypothetical protein